MLTVRKSTKYRALCRLLVAIIIIIAITNTVITAIVSDQKLFCLPLESGLKGLDVPGRVVMLADRWC